MLFLICHSAPAQSVAIWVCSCIRAATIPASSALFMVLFMPVSSCVKNASILEPNTLSLGWAVQNS